MVTEPALTPLASPLLLLIVAIVGSDELQVT